jgi:hypothetical protein
VLETVTAPQVAEVLAQSVELLHQVATVVMDQMLIQLGQQQHHQA